MINPNGKHSHGLMTALLWGIVFNYRKHKDLETLMMLKVLYS